MDRNQAIGLILISILVIVYFQWFAPKPQPPEETAAPAQQEQTVAEDPVVKTEEVQAVIEMDSVLQAQRLSQLGALAAGANGSEEIAILENKDLRIELTSVGGNVKEALLKEYFTWDKRPLILADNQSHTLNKLITTSNGQVDLSNLYYEVEKSQRSDTSLVTFSLNDGGRKVVEQIYSLAPEGFQLGYELKVNGVSTSDYASFTWDADLKRLEKEMQQARQKTTINYYDNEGNFDNLSETSTDEEIEKIDKGVKWISLKQKFFSSALISSRDLQNAEILTRVPPEEDTSFVKKAIAKFDVPLENNPMTFYYGPNHYQIMKKVTDGFKENVYLGWPVIKWFNKWLIIPVFNFLERYISNYGIIIIILSLFIKLLLSPLSYRSYVSMAKTKVLKPQLDEIKEKYPDDMQKAQAEQMKLYQQVGVNPLSGCIPLLLQMPILLAMFNFFPNSIELRQESFLWAHDLSTYDSILDLPFTIPFYGDHISLFTILMTASTILMTQMNSQMTTVQGPMKTMQYMMPVMFMVFLNNFAAGLTFYYFIANLITYGQQVVIRRFIDEDKIKQILEQNRKKRAGKKKSKFQMRLEEAMKARDEQGGKPNKGGKKK